MEKRKGPDLIHWFLSNEKGLDHIKEKKKKRGPNGFKKNEKAKHVWQAQISSLIGLNENTIFSTNKQKKWNLRYAGDLTRFYRPNSWRHWFFCSNLQEAFFLFFLQVD